RVGARSSPPARPCSPRSGFWSGVSAAGSPWRRPSRAGFPTRGADSAVPPTLSAGSAATRTGSSGSSTSPRAVAVGGRGAGGAEAGGFVGAVAEGFACGAAAAAEGDGCPAGWDGFAVLGDEFEGTAYQEWAVLTRGHGHRLVPLVPHACRLPREEGSNRSCLPCRIDRREDMGARVGCGKHAAPVGVDHGAALGGLALRQRIGVRGH